MPNDIIEVIQERLKMLCERKLICADECKVLKVLVGEIEKEYIKREQIVRCKDCVYMHHVFDHIWNIEADECWLHASNETGALGKNRTEPDGFCAWGERKMMEQ